LADGGIEGRGSGGAQEAEPEVHYIGI
jgi:hypothetical protein